MQELAKLMSEHVHERLVSAPLQAFAA